MTQTVVGPSGPREPASKETMRMQNQVLGTWYSLGGLLFVFVRGGSRCRWLVVIDDKLSMFRPLDEDPRTLIDL